MDQNTNEKFDRFFPASIVGRIYQIVFSVKYFFTYITNEGLLSFRNWFNMLIQSVFLRKACITHSAFIFINWFKMSIQMFFLRNAAPQKLQLIKRLLSFMNWINVVFHALFCCNSSIAKLTTTEIRISRQNWNGFFSNISHQMMI